MIYRRRRDVMLFLVVVGIAGFFFWIPSDVQNSLTIREHIRQVQRWSFVPMAGLKKGQVDHSNYSHLMPNTVISQNTQTPHRPQAEADYEQRMAERKAQVERHCKTMKMNLHYIRSNVPIVNVANRFMHCPITKAASTFWGRFVLKLNRSGPMGSPFEIDLNKSIPLPSTNLNKVGPKLVKEQFLANSTKSLFVREPYHRIFSAYVDKVFAPNPYYWNEWGYNLRRIKRWPRMVRRRKPCFHNLSFSDAVLLGAVAFHKTELHFMPVSKRCHPCQFRYDVIGKMETLTQDLPGLSRSLNLSLTQYFSSRQFRYDYAKDAIEDSINSPFNWTPDILRCMSKQEMGLRIWRKLQIRGLIDRRINFPYASQTFIKVTAVQFINASLSAHLASTDKDELKKQKRDAFIEAFRTVNMKYLTMLKGIYTDDFNMFGYDSSPPDVFDRSRNVSVAGAFHWSKPWTG